MNTTAIAVSPIISEAQLARFHSQTDRSSGTRACWIWRGAIDARNYGRFSLRRCTTVLAHRLAYALHHGSTPARLLVCHTCDNPSCVNPAHLFLGTHKDNARDMCAKGRHVVVTIGEKHHSAKLTTRKVKQIRAKYVPRKTSLAKLGRAFGVSAQVVHRIVHRKIWKHI